MKKIKYRIEHDSIGDIKVPADRLWGAQTQRSVINFKIWHDKVSLDVIYAVAVVKYACAEANYKCGKLSKFKKDLIQKVCFEILDGKLDKEFPTSAYQGGAGTQTNMNVNEVIARRGNQIARKKILHENDDVNMSQSTNDVIPTAFNIAALYLLRKHLYPAVDGLIETFRKMEQKYKDIVKMGRTHIQDAVPITFGQEVSGWRAAVENGKEMVVVASKSLLVSTLGATAVGTGSTAPLKKGYAKYACDALNRILKTDKFQVTNNMFQSTWSKDQFVFISGAIKALAMNLYKISQDVRFLASGPRSGFGEINIPQNEPGSSIMPGKVNPTQCELMSMACDQVVGHDINISLLASQANFELNTFGTFLMQNFVQMIGIFSDSINSFNKNCCVGITVNANKMKEYLDNSLMLVTALKDVIGYEKSSKIAKNALVKGISLKESAAELGYLTEKEFDKYIDPKKMCYN